MLFYYYETNREEEVNYNICDGYIEDSGLNHSFEYHLEYLGNHIKKLKIWSENANDVLLLINDDNWEKGVDNLLKLQVFSGINIKYNLNKNILEDNPKDLENETRSWLQAMLFLLSTNLNDINDKPLSEIGLYTDEEKKQFINIVKKMASRNYENINKIAFMDSADIKSLKLNWD